MRTIAWSALLAAAALGALEVAAAEGGVVVLTPSGCSGRYVVQTAGGYVLAEWFGGASPNKGDSVVGELSSFGFKDIFIVTQSGMTRAWIDDYFLSKERIVEKLLDKGCSW